MRATALLAVLVLATSWFCNPRQDRLHLRHTLVVDAHHVALTLPPPGTP